MPVDTAAESAQLAQDLLKPGVVREAAVVRLHALLLRVARAEAARRRSRMPEAALEEIDDLCVQAANDAVMSILRKLGDFKGQALFTTWACKFVIFEISVRLRRHAWRFRRIEPDETVWERLEDATPSALHSVERDELATALRRAVSERLTERQRAVFLAAAMEGVPIDVLAERFDSSRGAIYKTLHDARRKLRSVLTDAGFMEHSG